MELSIIAPIHNLDLTSKLSNTYMILGWLLEESIEYYEYYSKLKINNPSAYFILDNGANEGREMAPADLMFWAQKIKADELVLPDTLDNGELTYRKSIEFINQFGSECKVSNIKLMGVVQGRTFEEFNKCYTNMINNSNIEVIGLGYRNLIRPFIDKMKLLSDDDWVKMGITDVTTLRNELEDNSFYYTLSRIFFLKKYVDFQNLQIKSKKIHNLGLYNPIENKYYNKIFSPIENRIIRSNDSASLCQCAQADVLYDLTFGIRNKTKKLLDFKEKLTDNQLVNFYQNLQRTKIWLQ